MHKTLGLIFAITFSGLFSNSLDAVDSSFFKYPVPTISGENFQQWMNFVEPSEKEMQWNELRWHDSLAQAVVEAKKLNRPILLWAMNGHPCGEV